jgi:Glycosyl hydrolase family 99
VPQLPAGRASAGLLLRRLRLAPASDRIRRMRPVVAAGRSRGVRRWILLAALLASCLSLTACPTAAITGTSETGRGSGTRGLEAPSHSPVFAYYYMWFTPASWSRAKTDLPLLGAYNSADPLVIEQHVRWAKQAGIDGFIVSWKHEARLDAPLKTLVDEAHRQQFKLILLYEGLDVNRNPLSVDRIISDLQWFTKTYGSDPAFAVFGPPAVVWSGTWKFSLADIAKLRARVGAPTRVLLLGSDRSADEYRARQAVFDGDAYYWSSADPQRTPGFASRLEALGAEVLADHGKWIVPVTPGFDARLIGGTSIVPRRSGETYRSSWAVGASQNQSAIGIISWNEFSENSYIEPSRANQYTYLQITGQLTGHPVQGTPTISTLREPIPPPGTIGVDSSEGAVRVSPQDQFLSLLVSAGLIALIAFSAAYGRMRGIPH